MAIQRPEPQPTSRTDVNRSLTAPGQVDASGVGTARVTELAVGEFTLKVSVTLSGTVPHSPEQPNLREELAKQLAARRPAQMSEAEWSKYAVELIAALDGVADVKSAGK